MNRKVLIVAILVVAVILSVPYFFGVMTQHQIDLALYEKQKNLPAHISLETDAYELGWFSSTHRMRLRSTMGNFAEVGRLLTGDSSYAGQFDAVIESTLHHGPVPISALGLAEGFRPLALAVIESKITYELGDNITWQTPGAVYTTFDLDGSGDYVYLADQTPVDFGNGEVTGTWGGARLEGSFDAGMSRFAVKGTLEPLELSGMDGASEETMKIGPIQLSADQTRTPIGITTGPVNGTAPVRLTFNGATSIDPDPGDLLTYKWEFRQNGEILDLDGIMLGAEVTRRFDTAGTYSVQLTVTDLKGAVGVSEPRIITISARVDVTPPPVDEPPGVDIPDSADNRPGFCGFGLLPSFIGMALALSATMAGRRRRRL